MADWFDQNGIAPPSDENGAPLGAPPNSTWDGTTGQWKTTSPNDPSYDKTWGGYSSGDPATDPWLASVYQHQGWDLPGAGTTDTSGGGTGGGGTSSGGDGRATLSSFAAPTLAPAPRPYQPFTDTFSAPTAPADLTDKWDRTFQAPTAPADLMDKWDQTFAWDPSKIKDDPAYQFRQNEEQQAVQRSAAAKGTLLTGGTLKELQDRSAGVSAQFENDDYNRASGTYNTNFNTFTTDKNRRSQEFGNTFDRALQGYTTDFNTFEGDKSRRTDLYNSQFANARTAFLDKASIWNTNEGNRFSSESANRNDTFNMGRTNRMDDFGISTGLRQQNLAEDQALFNNNRLTANDQYDRLFRFADYGYGASNNAANGAFNAGTYGANTITDAGNARAAGTVGAANAWNNGITGASNAGSQAILMNQLRSGGTPPYQLYRGPLATGTY